MSEERDELGGEYLWDPSAPRDPEVARLEQLLARYRHADTPPALAPRRWSWRVALPLGLAAAAAALVLLFTARGPAYAVRGVDGLAAVRAGEWIEVGATPAEVTIADIGAVELDPGSRVRVDAIEPSGERALHALYLEEGALRARILAGPRVFQVDTPAGVSIDLGCEYRLEVRPEGRTRIEVLTGQIAFGFGGREVYVPAGAWCESVPGRGPTPPMFASTSDARRELVLKLGSGDAWTSEELAELLALESREDALPLFAMLSDPALDRRLRGAIHDRLAQAFERPSGVTRDGVVETLDRSMIEAWQERNKDWWRHQ